MRLEQVMANRPTNEDGPPNTTGRQTREFDCPNAHPGKRNIAIPMLCYNRAELLQCSKLAMLSSVNILNPQDILLTRRQLQRLPNFGAGSRLLAPRPQAGCSGRSRSIGITRSFPAAPDVLTISSRKNGFAK